jgi:tetratricopeptide (TPR) repeat protein
MVDVCRSALKTDKAGSYPVTFLGWAYLGLGRLDDAQNQITLEKWKDFDRQHCGLAWVAMERRQYPEAMTQFAETLRVNNANVSAFVGWGIACREQGRLDEAAQRLEKALCLDPMNADAHYHLGLTYLALGNLKAAKGHAKALSEVDSALASDLLQKISE